MPAVIIVAAVAAAATATAGAIKSAKGAKEEKKAKKAIAAYKRTPLDNAFAQTQVSRLGSDLQAEEQSRFSASALDSLRQSGTRGMIGGIGRLAMQNNLFNRQIGADLDKQQKDLDMLEAQDEVRIRALKEQRDRDNLAGLGRQMQQGREQKWAGFDTMMSAPAQFASSYSGGGGGGGDTGSTAFTDAFK